MTTFAHSINWIAFWGLGGSHWVMIAHKVPVAFNGRGAESPELRRLRLGTRAQERIT